MKSYSYQYETSPRKIKPEYGNNRKTTVRRKSQNAENRKQSNTNTKKAKEKKAKTKKEQVSKKQTVGSKRLKFSIGFKCFCIFVFFFMIIYRNSLITQSFAQIQNLKATIAELQKENNQLEINIQNSLNTNNIEQAAKELLGMQKLTNKQIAYISLSKKDYVEPRTEEVIIDTSPSLFESIVEKIKSFF